MFTRVNYYCEKMAEWSPERELELIEMWRQQPVLYDTTHAGYLRRGKKFSALTEFAEHFGTMSALAEMCTKFKVHVSIVVKH